MAHTTIVSSATSLIDGPNLDSAKLQKSAHPALRQGLSPTGKEAKTVGMSILRESILKGNISDSATTMFCSHDQAKSISNINHISIWFDFCSGGESNPYDPR